MAQLLDPEQWGRGPQTGAGEVPDDRPPGPRRTGGAPAPQSAHPAASNEPAWDPFADEPAATQRREPRSGATSPPRAGATPPRRSSRLPLILVLLLVVLALVAAGIWAAARGLLPFGSGGGAAAPEMPAASAPATDAPEPSDPPAVPAGTPLPASCDVVYSGSMRDTIEGAGLVLNPEWHSSSGETRLPSDNPELQQLLGSLERLDCAWLEESPGEVAIYTSISQVTDEQAAAAETRLTELGYGTIEELGGVRYVTETSGDGNTLGESHFLRDGLWFGTLWINHGPTGYTADMVTQVLG
jgi:hypothetical protein